jgi:hypothetical protein
MYFVPSLVTSREARGSRSQYDLPSEVEAPSRQRRHNRGRPPGALAFTFNRCPEGLALICARRIWSSSIVMGFLEAQAILASIYILLAAFAAARTIR